MAGKIQKMIHSILEQNASNNPMLARVIKTKMILKGINPARFSADSPDDPAIIAKLESMMRSFAPAGPPQTGAIRPASANGKIRTGFSTHPDTADCVRDLRKQLAPASPRLVIFFAAMKHAPETVSLYMQEAFPGAQVFGCSTAGEITSGQMLSDAIVAMAFSTDMLQDFKIEVVRNLGDPNAIQQAVACFDAHFGQPLSAMDPARHVGILLIDGLAGMEETLMETLGDLTNVPFIGGSAGDDLQFSGTYVYANGHAYKNAVLLALLKPSVDFSFVKTQSFRLLGKTLRVSKANESRREVLQFNDRPAIEAYAEAVGVSSDRISQCFMRHPVGLIVQGEPFVRSPQRIQGDSMYFYCSIKEDMELSLLESTDMLGDTARAIAEAREKLGRISGILDFDCILRTLDLRQQNLTDAYGKLFEGIPTAGFSTYGEQYIGHINQTATMLVFG